jgi:hypothetical protein
MVVNVLKNSHFLHFMKLVLKTFKNYFILLYILADFLWMDVWMDR